MAPYRRTTRSIRKVTTAPLDRAWMAMRAAKGGRFTVPDVVAASDVHRISFMRYLKGLRRTGFVKKVQNHVPSMHRPAVFLLLINTGPFRPHLQIDGVVYDRNTATEHQPIQEVRDGD